MKVLLLAAGYGTRLKPITDSIPKCLVKINGKPLLEYWFDLINDSGIKEILINTHYLPYKVEEFVQKSKLSKFVKIVYEEKLLGTGGTLLKNRSFFDNDEIMLIHADNLSLFDVDAFIKNHANRPDNTNITMMTFTTETPESCGIVELDEKGVVRKFYEKVNEPHGNLANAAVFILEPSVIDFLSGLRRKEIDFSKEVIPRYVGRINTFHNNIYHRDIGTLESLQIAELDFPAVNKKYNQGKQAFILNK